MPGLVLTNLYGPRPTGFFLKPSGPTCSKYFLGVIQLAALASGRDASLLRRSINFSPSSSMLISSASYRRGGGCGLVAHHQLRRRRSRHELARRGYLLRRYRFGFLLARLAHLWMLVGHELRAGPVSALLARCRVLQNSISVGLRRQISQRSSVRPRNRPTPTP